MAKGMLQRGGSGKGRWWTVERVYTTAEEQNEVDGWKSDEEKRMKLTRRKNAALQQMKAEKFVDRDSVEKVRHTEADIISSKPNTIKIVQQI